MNVNLVRSAMMVLVLLVATGAGNSASAGFITYQVVVNTSTISGTDGSLEFQYNPAMTPATISTAVVSPFTTVGGTISPTTEVNGSVTGSLASLPMTLTANTPFNDILENFKFGTSLTFNVTLSTTALVADRFSLTLWNGNISAVDSGTASPVYNIMPDDGSGAALTIDYNGVTASTIRNSAQVSVSAVPEPASITMLAIAGACLLVCGRLARRGRTA